jgi:Ribbon-helix-helix protein, copG family
MTVFVVQESDRQQNDAKSCIRDLGRSANMTDETVVTLKLNQQQLELIDRTVARGIAPDRAALVRLALHEYAAARLGAGAGKDAKR